MDMKELSEILQRHGICGAGGAGFPTYAKLNSSVKTIIMNCAECEPLLKLHRQLLQLKAEEILYAFHVLQEAIGAEEAIIAVKHSYTKTVSAVEAEIGRYGNMELKLLDEIYPAGDEVMLIYETTGKVVPPGGIPVDIGVAVFNVETVYNLALALREDAPVTNKLVSVVGEVKRPVTVRVPLGMTVGEVVELAGGVTCSRPAYVMGGPMMGFLGTEHDLITKTSNAIIVLPEDHYVVQRKKANIKIDLMRAAASCCQCEMCTDLCPRFLLGHPSHPHLFMRAATCKDVQQPQIFLDTLYCCSCGLCSMYSCPQGLSPAALLTEYKAGLRKAGIRPEKKEPKPVPDYRKLRRVPVERLMRRLCLTHYNVPAPLENELVPAGRVKLLTRQHIGAPAVPVVKAGDAVEAGQLLAEPGTGLSLPVHASISGTVTEVTDAYIKIDGNQKGRAQ